MNSVGHHAPPTAKTGLEPMQNGLVEIFRLKMVKNTVSVSSARENLQDARNKMGLILVQLLQENLLPNFRTNSNAVT